MKMGRFLLVCMVLLAVPALRASAAELTDVDHKILDRELELFELNAQIRTHTTPHSLWGFRRWSAYSINNNVLTAIGAGINANQRLINERHPGKINKKVLIRASWCRINANIVSTLGAATEYVYDDFQHLQMGWRGFHLHSVVSRVMALDGELKDLFAQRRAIVTPDDTKGTVLHELRDMGFSQFARFYGEYKGNRARNKISYILTGASNAVSGTGSYAGVVANRQRFKTKLGGTGGICDIISGSINMTVPLAVRLGDWAERRFVEDKYCKKLHCNLDYAFHTDDSTDGNVLDRLHKLVENEEAGKAQAAHVAQIHTVQNEANALISGGSKLVNGLGTAIGTYHRFNRPADPLKLTGSASLVYMLGNIISGTELTRIYAVNELSWHKQAKTHNRPFEVWDKRVADIQTLRRELHAGQDGSEPAH